VVSELELRPIHALLSERFAIPSYQRGYRWKARQVRELLDDIYEFERTRNERPRESFYCLQPVVVTPRKDGSWELIDGQQRLTTILLVLNALAPLVELLGKSPYGLEYDTRPNSAEFLSNPDETCALSNIDFFHLFEAHEAILEWFAERDGTAKLQFLNCLLDPEERNVRVIWYQLPDRANPIDVFVRLNVGKIRLTNAELIRALFLRKGNFASTPGKADQSRLASAQQYQIAQEWDAVEKRLQDDPFWYFIHDGPSPWPARIEYLFDVRVAELGLAADEHDEYRTFLAYQQHLSKGGDARQHWREIRQLALRLDEWAADRVLFHLVGFLVSTEERPCREVVVELLAYRRKSSRRSFDRFLRTRIFDQFVGGRSPAGELESLGSEELRERVSTRLSGLAYTDRVDSKQRIRATLLLFNVASLLRNTGSNLRFPFDLFKKESWDIEHIRSVKSDMPGRPETQKAWLDQVLRYWDDESRATTPVSAERKEGDGAPSDASRNGAEELSKATASESPPDQIRESEGRDALLVKARRLREAFERQDFVELYDQILAYFGESVSSDADHGIDNLALLDLGTNRSYKNAVFPVKRRRILELDKLGTFVPLCTTNVFLKYYSHSVQQMMFWRRDDERAYMDAMVEMLTHFFAEASR